MNELPKTYDPSAVEDEIYRRWQAADAFKPTDEPNAIPFCIINPPTNANGVLHIGHAVGITLQDLMARYHRMRGEAVLWLPGFDHAGFETQVVFDKKLEKAGRSRFKIPRAELYQEMYDFSQESIANMKPQFAKLGASLDWSREKFTLDPKVVQTVYQTFKQLYDDDLVYRGERPINWCVKHQTSLAELEVVYEERTDPLYYLKYGPLTIATVRPESQGGDVAIAVHPDDPRYQEYIGQTLKVELADRTAELPVIADTYVKPEFGTGAVKVTPALDPNDYEMAKRHNLPVVEIVDQFGRLTEAAGQFAGLKVAEARIKILEQMKAKNLIEKIDPDYIHSVSLCYKCKNPIEPRIMPQWFIAMTKTGKSGKNLRDDAVKAVQNGQVKFVTPRFNTTFYRWMANLRDWNISHQIVWGIQLPIWYCRSGQADCQPIVTDGSIPKACPTCGQNKLERDSDVFNTWFSSGQWPFAVLKAQENPADFARFYPTSVMETGYDILFFWIARMIMLGLYATGDVPFRDVYLHGLVRDKDRQKMSKSKGNVIDPLGVAAEYGSDAVRLALIFGTAAGNDIVIAEDKIKGMRNFANKLWNISRFILMNTNEAKTCSLTDLAAVSGQSELDHQILTKLDALTTDISSHIEQFQFHLAAEKLYDFIWHELADIYIEGAKAQLQNQASTAATQTILLAVLYRVVQLLHPFMPFITEEIYQSLPISDKPALLMTGPWPTAKPSR